MRRRRVDLQSTGREKSGTQIRTLRNRNTAGKRQKQGVTERNDYSVAETRGWRIAHAMDVRETGEGSVHRGDKKRIG